MKAELSRVHWGRILLTSILIVILVIFVFDKVHNKPEASRLFPAQLELRSPPTIVYVG